MKKILLSAAVAGLLSNVNAACEDTTFSGVFLGGAFVMSFDQDKSDVLAFGSGEYVEKSSYANKKKNKTAFGGQIILGYGYHFPCNLYVAIMHESLFASKAKVTYSGYADLNHVLENTRKCYTPSFGVAVGYIVDDWNFGIRSGFSIEKFKLAYTDLDGYMFAKGVVCNKTQTATSPFVGAYVEYKIDTVVVFANVDYTFGKNKKHTLIATVDKTDRLDIKHKHPSWKVALGVKANINNIIAKFK